MGGAMALHLACRYHPDVAGVFALSSFLNKDSAAFQVTNYNICVKSASKVFKVLPLCCLCVCVFSRPLKTGSTEASHSLSCSSATAPLMSWCFLRGGRRRPRC